MLCTDSRFTRPENSVPPKKSHYWRTEERSSTVQILTSQCNSMPESCETSPVHRGAHSTSSSRSEHCPMVTDMSQMKISAPSEMPLDFSVKKSSSNQLPNHPQNGLRRPRSPPSNISVLNMSNYKVSSPNGEMKSEDFNNMHQRKVPNEKAVSPRNDVKRETHEENTHHQIPTLQRPEPSMRVYPSPMGSSPSPPTSILKERLTRDSPGVLPVVAYANGQSAYTNGFGSVFPQANMLGGVLADSALFSPSDLLAHPPGMAFMSPQLGMISPLPPPGCFDMKTPPGSRKMKHERPFKSYSLTLQEDYPMGYGGTPSSIDVGDSPQPSAASRSCRPQPMSSSSPNNASMNTTNGSSNSDSTEAHHHEEESNHNVPHSSVPSGSLSDTGDNSLDSSGRKRKPVADAEKDENYWKKRVKNNLAAKRSREARRRKEDMVAEHAQYFRTQYFILCEQNKSQILSIQEQKLKIAALESAYMNLAAENRMLKQAAAQKRCEQCGNRLSE